MTHSIDAPQADSVTKLAEKAAVETVRQFFGIPDAEKYYSMADTVRIIAAAIRSGIEEAEKEAYERGKKDGRHEANSHPIGSITYE